MPPMLHAVSPVRSGLLALMAVLVTAFSWSGEASAHSVNERFSSDHAKSVSVEVDMTGSDTHAPSEEHSAIGGHCHPGLECSLVFVLTNVPRARVPVNAFGAHSLETEVRLTAFRANSDLPPPKPSVLI
jgi:hypothetical protein